MATPFAGQNWQTFLEQAAKTYLPTPRELRQTLRDAAINPANPAPWPQEEVDAVYPMDSPDLDEQDLVAAAWARDERLYSPWHIYRQCALQIRYGQWKKSKDLPDKLTRTEYLYLASLLRVKGYNVTVPDPTAYTHFAPLTDESAPQSRVGKLYGTWRVQAVTSQDEDSNPVYYSVKCVVCDFVHPQWNRTRLSHSCPNCDKIKAVAKRQQDAEKLLEQGIVKQKRKIRRKHLLKETLTVYLTTTGTYVAAYDRPKNAVAVIRITAFDEEVNVEHLTPQEVAAAELADLSGEDPQSGESEADLEAEKARTAALISKIDLEL